MTAHSEYVKIDSGDPGGDIDAAFSAMSAEVETVDKPIDSRMINERGVFKAIGMAKGEALMHWIESQPNEAVPARVKSWFRPSEQGVDVLDDSVQLVFAGAVQAGVIEPPDLVDLKACGQVESPKYHNLTKTKIQNTRDIKAKGLL